MRSGIDCAAQVGFGSAISGERFGGKMIRKVIFGIALSVVVLCLPAVQPIIARPASAKSANCDRACLNGFVDQYMAAVAAHDPSKLPTAAKVRYTENNVEMPLGEGLWQTYD